MKQKVALICLSLVLLLLAAGCWNRRELNDIALEVGFAIDKKGSQYRVSSQVVDPGEVAAKQATASRTPVTMYHATGKNLFEARRKMTTVSPRKIYASHLRMLVIGEAVAREGIGNVLDFITRDHEYRTDFYIVVAKGSRAENILEILTPLEKVPAINLFSSLETSEKSWGPALTVTMDELISDLTSAGKNPVLSGVQIKGDPEIGETRENVELIDSPGQLQYSGLAVFNKDKLIGWLTEEESKGYTYIVDRIQNTAEEVSCPKGGKLVLEVIRSGTELKGKVINGKPEIEITVETEGNVGEVECLLDVSDPQAIYELEKRVEQAIKDRIQRTIKKVQRRYKVDIFGFGQAIHFADPQAWRQLKQDWNEMFVDVAVHVTVDFKIRRLGTVSKSFLEEMKE
ncbi:Ger(x)C family spore germination protein [Brevibacillus humidisoli]|uniref:Ger(x)C family spore germination protein n=1 Tax=Brevibacillus humidisoli TaxID=2895522 RepID=UPI001E63C0C7|nr:Ger(x)C family spore germination protein [Brevibacillus humidisoli]UFJ39835.1 Ger(x)C family spore germination protein [Brevibacillus humidisoli]